MLSQEIREGDQLFESETLIYTVAGHPIMVPPHVIAVVRFEADGGFGERMWEIGKHVPLTRPDPAQPGPRGVPGGSERR